MERLLVADIGGSSSRWAVVPERGEARIIEGVQGHNPAIGDGEAFVVALRDRFAKEKDLLDARRVIVYGAGCGTIERQARMHALLKPLFVAASIEVNNDLLGTARGLCADW